MGFEEEWKHAPGHCPEEFSVGYILRGEKKKAGHLFYGSARFSTVKDIKTMLHRAGQKISKIWSTLLQRPEDSRIIEEPVEGYARDAGFLCIEVKKNTDERLL